MDNEQINKILEDLTKSYLTDISNGEIDNAIRIRGEIEFWDNMLVDRVK
jgi:hypothetical protein